jgi:hypothetical protein
MTFMAILLERPQSVLNYARQSDKALPVGRIEVPASYVTAFSRPGILLLRSGAGYRDGAFLHVPVPRVVEAVGMSGATEIKIPGTDLVSVALGGKEFEIRKNVWEVMCGAYDYYGREASALWPGDDLIVYQARNNPAVDSYVRRALLVAEAYGGLSETH